MENAKSAKVDWKRAYYSAEADAHALREALKRLIACYSVSHSPEQRQRAWEQAKKAVGDA
jgi:hypothetical protein